jgi:hypothetical protein
VTGPINETESVRLQAVNKELRARCEAQTARVADLETELFDRGMRFFAARPTPRLDTLSQQLVAALAEVDRLRVIEQAARAYVNCPEQPASTDPGALSAWDQHLADLYLGLRASLQEGTPR